MMSAGEVMAAVQTAMLADLVYPRLSDAILAHPTMAEGLGLLFSNIPPLGEVQATHAELRLAREHGLRGLSTNG
jgi:hypothetical protein